MRASDAPEQWGKLLEAVNAGDYKLAHKICITYGFDGRAVALEKPKVPHGHYAAMSPEGDIIHNKFARVLSRRLGFSNNYIVTVIKKTNGRPITQGKMKGWTFWQEL